MAAAEILAEYNSGEGLAIADGCMVIDGIATISTTSSTYSDVKIGLPYTSKIQTMPLNAPGSLQQGRTKRISSVILRMYRSMACKIGTSWTDYDTVDFDASTISNRWNFYNTDDLPAFTGDYQVDYDGDYETEASMFIQTNQPTGLTILSIIPEYETY